MNNRIEKLKANLFEVKREVSLERALLYTESYKETEGEPTIIRRAKATERILDKVAIAIREGELVVGNRTVKPRSGIVSPEMDPYWILDELDTIHERPQDAFFISEDDKRIYRDELYSYWKEKSMKDFINSKISDEIKVGSKLNIFKLNQTDKGQGHIIMDNEIILSKGYEALEKELEEYSNKATDNSFYKAALIIVKATRRHILRYEELALREAAEENDFNRKEELLEIAKVCRKISKDKPESFYEALQLLWFTSIVAQYESNASSISLGRMDMYLYPFYKNDLDKGVSKEYLKELLECFYVLTNDVVLIRSRDSARYFAGFPTGYTVALGGLDETGKSSINELSYLCLEAYHDIRLPQPNLAVRVNEFMERRFLNLTSETIRLGTGVPQIFNDEVIIPAFLNRGVSLEDARNYAIVGCVELTIPGKTYGLHDIALFNLLKVMEVTLREIKDKDVNFDEILKAIKDNTDHYIKLMVEGSNIVDIGHKEYAPVPFLSAMIDNCIEKGLDVTEGGAKYNFSGVQGIGNGNLSDSLYVIKKAVFEEGRVTLSELVDILDKNYEGYEELRESFINDYDKYGNDEDEVDLLGSDLLRHYCKSVEVYDNVRGGKFVPGSYTVSAHVPLGQAVGATPDGRLDKEQLADGGLSPMVGRDTLGPTAVLKSVSKLDNYLNTNGSLLNCKFSPSALEGDKGINKLSDFIEAYMKLKIQHIQFNVITVDLLKEAQKNPEKYKGLVVRVAGYSAFFVELSKEIQNDIINRTEHNL